MWTRRKKKSATCWEIPVCTVCSASSSLTKLLGKLKSWKYLRENLSSGAQGLVMVLKTFSALNWPSALLCPLSSSLLRTTVPSGPACVPYFSVSKRALVAIVCSIFMGGAFLGSDVGLLGILLHALVPFLNLTELWQWWSFIPLWNLA